MIIACEPLSTIFVDISWMIFRSCLINAASAPWTIFNTDLICKFRAGVFQQKTGFQVFIENDQVGRGDLILKVLQHMQRDKIDARTKFTPLIVIFTV